MRRSTWSKSPNPTGTPNTPPRGRPPLPYACGTPLPCPWGTPLPYAWGPPPLREKTSRFAGGGDLRAFCSMARRMELSSGANPSVSRRSRQPRGSGSATKNLTKWSIFEYRGRKTRLNMQRQRGNSIVETLGAELTSTRRKQFFLSGKCPVGPVGAILGPFTPIWTQPRRQRHNFFL